MSGASLLSTEDLRAEVERLRERRGLEHNKRIRYDNGDVYVGDAIANGAVRHGRGRHECSNGDVYEGDWQEDKRHGRHGRMEFAESGLVYEGEWQNDMAEGQGWARYPDGSEYTGEFSCDARHGWGKLILPNGDEHEGEWSRDEAHGLGCYRWADGDSFEGEYERGERVRGKFLSFDGKVEYCGGWREGRRHGYGILIDEWNGFRYKGAFKADQPHGAGECAWPHLGKHYAGQWEAGEMRGKGKLQWPDGAYEGDFERGKPHGLGVEVLASGEEYAGHFASGEKEGLGRYRNPHADEDAIKGIVGQFKAGQAKGLCIARHGNGWVYAGEVERGVANGMGTARDATHGTAFHGYFEDGKWVQSKADPSLSSVEGEMTVTAGETLTLSIVARDTVGRRRLSFGDHFRAWAENPTTGDTISQASVNEHPDGGTGLYTATLTITRAGECCLCVTDAEGNHVAESPYWCLVLPGQPKARLSEVRSDALKGAVALGAGVEVRVIPRDGYGNRCAQPVPIDKAELKCPHVQPTPMAIHATGDQGEHRLHTLVPSHPCRYTLTLERDGTPIGDCPRALVVADPSGVLECDKPATTPSADPTLEGGEEEEEEGATEQADEEEDAPVVERLEDVHLVAKYQRRKKQLEREERMRHLDAKRRALHSAFAASTDPGLD